VAIRWRARAFPFRSLQLEHAAVGRVVVDDQHALAGERRLHADEIALPGRGEIAHRGNDREIERRALALATALRPHPAAHQLGETLADREAEAGAAVLARRRRIGLRKRLKEPAHSFGGEADAGIAHGERQLDAAPFARLRGDGQHDLALVGELHRIGEQIQDDLAQPCHVADDRRRNVAFEHVRGVEMLLDGARADEVERRLDALAQVERLRLDVHPPGLDLREIEDVVDDRQQRVADVADRRGVVALLVVERGVEQQPLMPITAFIGVRISWLIVARNELLASLADSAAARASCACLNRRAFWIAITA
jgi:hypothetical protein